MATNARNPIRRLLTDLSVASHPFVSRLLRGKRLQRHLVASALLTMGTVLVALWVALGAGSFEREVRQQVGLEHRADLRELLSHTIYVLDDTLDDEELAAAQQARDRIVASGDYTDTHWAMWGLLDYGLRRSVSFARGAIDQRDWCPASEQGRIDALARALDRAHLPEGIEGSRRFECSPEELALVDRIAEDGLVPRLQRYSSPLTPAEVGTMIGMAAAAVLSVLLLVVAPLWAGSLVAQETHENTLQPLTGTALTPRQLAIGLLAGPLAVVALLAAPLAVVLLACAAAVGDPGWVVGALALMLVVSLLLSVGSQMLGLSLGARRSPGVVGVLLSAALLTVLIAGTGLALEGPTKSHGAFAVLPDAGVVHLLRQGLLPELAWPHGSIGMGFGPTEALLVVSAVAFLVLAWLLQQAVVGRIPRSPHGLLTRVQTFVGAGTLSAVSLLAVSFERMRFPELVGLTGCIALPGLLALLMARVPTGDTPPAMRRVPVVALLGELAAWSVLHLAMCMLAADHPDLSRVLGRGLPHIVWGLGVAGLVAIRHAAAPATIWARVVMAVSAFAAVAELAMGLAMSATRHGPRSELPLFDVSVMLGLLQLGLLVALPWALLSGLRRQGVTLGRTPPSQP